jgi:general secretion pathway protein D
MSLAAVSAPPSAFAASEHDQPATYTFAFQDAEVSQVADAILGQSIGVTYTIDPSVTAKLTFRIDKRLTREQLLKTFEQVLAQQDIVLVKQGGSLYITSRAKAKSAATIDTSTRDIHRAGYQTVSVPLTYATPSEVAKALQSISSNSNLVVYVDDKTGLLIIGGTGDELDAALAAIHVFDRGGLQGAKIRWYELKQATAATVVEDLDKILKAAGAGNVTIVPLNRLNGLFAFARTDEQLDKVDDWISKLDVPSQETGTSLWVYHPRSLSADSLASTLSTVLLGQPMAGTQQTQPLPKVGGAMALPGQQLAVGQFMQGNGMSSFSPMPGQAAPYGQSLVPTPMPPPGPPPQGGQTSLADEEPIRIGVERETNSLLIQCSATRWLQIQRMLEQIDQTPGQVLIEASILEVTLNDQLKLGVDWSVLGDAGRLAIASAPDIAGAAAQLPGFAATLLTKNIQVAVNTLGTLTKVDVVSAPKIIVLDNHTARLDVGDQVPVVTQSAQGTVVAGSPVLNSIDYENTGVIMTVTPRITGDNRIFLDLSEQVSTAVSTNTSGIDSPTIQQREFDSSLVLASGGTVALGGLISSTKSRSDSGIPFLKDAPWIGTIFKSKNDTTQRDELIVLITATILKDQPAADQAMAKLLADMHDIQAHGLLKK